MRIPVVQCRIFKFGILNAKSELLTNKDAPYYMFHYNFSFVLPFRTSQASRLESKAITTAANTVVTKREHPLCANDSSN